jgi:hypothetical protein
MTLFETFNLEDNLLSISEKVTLIRTMYLTQMCECPSYPVLNASRSQGVYVIGARPVIELSCINLLRWQHTSKHIGLYVVRK